MASLQGWNDVTAKEESPPCPFEVRERAVLGGHRRPRRVQDLRAAIIDSHHGIEVGEVADSAPGPGQLVVRVAACGVCGSDLKARPAMPHGTVMGQEFCVEMVALGAEVGGMWREGVQAAVLPVMSCGTCSWCRAGDVAHCQSARLVGLGGSRGGCAEFAVNPWSD
jgi:(R,R)-butanediol dehydrogenase / meso-butanediol dehydrogenase / diacetyl reductase